MRTIAALCASSCLFIPPAVHAAIFGQVRGIVEDAQHRPVRGAQVTVRAAGSALAFTATTDDQGRFHLQAVPLGDYVVSVAGSGFAGEEQRLSLAADTAPELRYTLQPAAVQQSVTVAAQAEPAGGETATPTTLLSRNDIVQTPGADRTDSLAMITDYVPGAYITHDMLHMRGGHQVSWLLDGVEVPNTNIASNLGAQIDPKDIDYLSAERGSYPADEGDRTYGAFNIVPRTGFERDREAELVLSAGNYLQTNDQLSFGDHSQRAAYYLSLTGNRSDYGLSTPVAQTLHDAANGEGGFLSLVWNRAPADQFRLVAQGRHDFFQIPYDPDPTDFENLQFNSSGLRDTQAETDSLAVFSWLHTFSSSTVLQVSPFFHRNGADYQPSAADTPVATTADRNSTYAGAQASVTTAFARQTLQAGLYAFGQHDRYLFGAGFNDNSGQAPFLLPDTANGGVVEEYLSDNFKATSWLTLIAGLRQSRFGGQFVENYTDPRIGASLRIPKLGWVFRGFYGRFYQPPPLLTAAGPIVQFAAANNTGFQPLHGERDEEHQFGVAIPLHGWLLDADTFKTRVNNFLDHSNIGNSSLYFPVTVDGALVRAWELTLHSPRLWRYGQVHLAYSNQIAEQRGNITGGLVCEPIGDPACDAGFSYTPVDHDQRNTLSLGGEARLPQRWTASANFSYGSGFTNGDPDPTTPYPNAYLPAHTSVDLAGGKSLGERLTLSVNALNLANQRVLLDNSLTFGGFHVSDPREIYAEVRYRFRY